MALEFKKSDQDTVINVANDFITFYYNSMNNKNYDDIFKYLKKFTTISGNKCRYFGDNISSYYKLFSDSDAKFSNIDFETLHSGAKRINILVSGMINFIGENGRENRYFTEYIHCGTSKENEFWIQTILFKLI